MSKNNLAEARYNAFDAAALERILAAVGDVPPDLNRSALCVALEEARALQRLIAKQRKDKSAPAPPARRQMISCHY
jgi:hypothetical protein